MELHLLDLDGEGGGSSSHIEVNLSMPVTEAASVACFKPAIVAFSQATTESDFDEKGALKQLQQQQREAPPVSGRPKQKDTDIIQSPAPEIDDEEMKMIGQPQA